MTHFEVGERLVYPTAYQPKGTLTVTGIDRDGGIVVPIEQAHVVRANVALGQRLDHDVIRHKADNFLRVQKLVAMARRNPLMWCLELWHYADGRSSRATPEERVAAFERAAGEP